MKRALIKVGITAVALTGAACGSSTGQSATATPATAKAASATVVKVAIKNFSFIPANLTLKAGSSVEITNEDSVIHTFTALNGSFNSGSIMPGQSVTVKIPPGSGTQAVKIAYQCSIHQYMTGTITIEP